MNCPVCRGPDNGEVFRLLDIPTQDGRLWPTREAALRSPTGDITLHFCRRCTLIWNSSHDPDKIDFVGYDVSLEHSALFREFTQGLAERLVNQYGIRHKVVLDIGCGKGYFLRKICRVGNNRGLGFDPSYAPPTEGEVEEIRAFSKPYGSEHRAFTADLISCRHVIDIAADPRQIPSLVFAAHQGQHPVFYAEDPDALYTFGSGVAWNVVYEHKTWFTRHSLRYLFEDVGFSVMAVNPCWHNEYLALEATIAGRVTPTLPTRSEVNDLEAVLRSFASTFAATTDAWQKRFDQLVQQHHRVAVWGAGARCVTLFSQCDLDPAVVVDVNPDRHGLFLPRSGHEILPPTQLVEHHPDVVLITNPTYEEEIKGQARSLGFGGQFLTL